MPSKVAFLFPGQGRIPEALPVNIERFSRLLSMTTDAGLQLADWVLAGDKSRLGQTDASQPILFLDSLCRERMLRDAGWYPICVAGHSLGEYAALVSAGVLGEDDAMRAVIERGRLMQDIDGTMVAILKLDLDTVTTLCQGTEAVVANHNAVTQIIVSGAAGDIQTVTQRAEDAGARCMPLTVSGPFHSPLMQPAQDALLPLLDTLVFREPTMPVVSGVSGQSHRQARDLKGFLQRQITSPVRWVDVSKQLEQLGVETAVEVGSGEILTRLGRRSQSSIRFLTFEEAIHERI